MQIANSATYLKQFSTGDKSKHWVLPETEQEMPNINIHA